MKLPENLDVIIYHRDCPDGFCAAFIAQMKYPTAALVGTTYGWPVPYDAVREKDVLVVDFSWKRDECVALQGISKFFHILDHHITAQAELGGLPFATFDMNRSAAALTFDELFFYEDPLVRPWYVDYVQDRDLWRWELPRSKEVSGFIMALPHTVEAWSCLDKMTWEQAADKGDAIRLHIEHYVEKVSAQAQWGFVNGKTVAVANAPYTNISDVCNRLCETAEIGLGWFERGDGMMQFSLRSVGDLDVSEIAKKLGGGGHKNASGFQVSLAEGRKILDGILNR